MLAVIFCDHTTKIDHSDMLRISEQNLRLIEGGYILKPLYNFVAKRGSRIILYDLETQQTTDILEYDPAWSIIPDTFYSD